MEKIREWLSDHTGLLFGSVLAESDSGGVLICSGKARLLDRAVPPIGEDLLHYEMASYGCLHAWATLLGNTKAAGILAGILVEEKAANEGLTKLAEAKCNKDALGLASPAVKSEASKGPPERKTPKVTGKEPLVAAGVR